MSKHAWSRVLVGLIVSLFCIAVACFGQTVRHSGRAFINPNATKGKFSITVSNAPASQLISIGGEASETGYTILMQVFSDAPLAVPVRIGVKLRDGTRVTRVATLRAHDKNDPTWHIATTFIPLRQDQIASIWGFCGDFKT